MAIKTRSTPADLERPDGALGHYDERTPLSTPLMGQDGAAKLGKAACNSQEGLSLTREPLQWMRQLSACFSWRLIVMVICSNHVLKGFVSEGLVTRTMEFIFGEFRVSAARLQMLKAAAISPWALKPVVALMADVMPISGYKKMPYIVLTTLASFVAALGLGLRLVNSLEGIVLCLFLIFLQVSTINLLVDATLCEEVKENASCGPQLFTFSWLGIQAGQVLGLMILGPLIYHLGPRFSFLIAAPLIALMLWPALANFLGEKPLPEEERAPNTRVLRRHPVLCALTLLVGVLVLALLMGTFFLPEGSLVPLAIFICIAVPTSLWFFLRPEISGPITFYFIFGILTLNTDGALFYFYTDSADAFPSGPHFTAYFYTTGLGVAGVAGTLTGIVTGSDMFKTWTYRSILRVTMLAFASARLLLIPVLMRWNRSAGLPDGLCVLFVVFLQSMCFAWRWIPKQVMSAHLTPQGMESTMSGLIAGTANMSMILSQYLGGFVLQLMNVRPTGAPGDHYMLADLWKVESLGALAPCCILCFLPYFVPATSQTEALITERRDSATHGSPYERLSARWAAA
mmetsp:Transcript_39848/g.127704  ORF Transcript_39848/g.127704 Transcript_39848/m.127704 type:complete len:571 (+) Transcript_39848:119-1831(+)